MRLDPRLAAEVVRCRDDPDHLDRHLRLVGKEGALLPFRPHACQRRIVAALDESPWTFVLKARRVGCSTAVSRWIFHRVMFHPHMQAVVLAHLDESAQEILRIHQTFHDNLPEPLRNLFPLRKSNTQELAFAHGGRIRVASARTEKLRSSGYQIVHASEVAQYGDVKKMMRSAFSAADGAATIVMETTAAGLNEAWHFWNGTGEFAQAQRFRKLFVSWLDDPTATVPRGSTMWTPPFEAGPLADWEAALRTEVPGITEGQLAFARKELVKQGGDVQGFDQEFPTSAAKAFIVSGRPYFPRLAEVPFETAEDGLRIFREPIPYHVYAVGVDVAAGLPDGDRSAVMVLDVTDCVSDPKAVPVEAAGLYVRQEVIPFADRLLALLRRYNSAMVCIERNNHGIVVVQRLKHAGHPHMYRTIVPGKVGIEGEERIGWDTTPNSRPLLLSRFHEAVALRGFVPRDPRLRAEMTAFQWDRTGTPDHPPGGSSDMVFATAMAFQAATQCAEAHARDVIFDHRPHSFEERIQFEMATGIMLDSFDGAFGDDPQRIDWGSPLNAAMR